MTGLTKPAKNYVTASSKLYHDACTINTIYFIILPNTVFINILSSSDFDINYLILLCTECLFYEFSILRQLFSNSSHEVTKQTSDCRRGTRILCVPGYLPSRFLKWIHIIHLPFPFVNTEREKKEF